MFNVRIKRYLNTEQIQIFTEPLLSSGSEREDKRKFSYETGEIFPTNSIKWFNYFDEEQVDKSFEWNGKVYNQTFNHVPDAWVRRMGDPIENMKRSVRRSKNMIYDVAKSNDWNWFFTLTFNPNKVDSFDYDITTTKLSNWLKYMRKKCPNMKYLVVPELHESGRWHFHGLFANVENMKFVDSDKRDKKGRIIYNVDSYKLGFSTATQIEDLEKACSYIAKYITFDLCSLTKGKKRYWTSRNVDMPIVEEYLTSLNNAELKRVMKEADYKKTCYSEYCDVTYLELPIYTTNTRRLVTSD